MSETPQSFDDSDKLDEQLSAYLDGELSNEEVANIKRRLRSDESLQRRLEALKNHWTLLDQLPRENASSNFAASTVEMVAIRASSASGGIEKSNFWRTKTFPRWLLISSAAVLSGMVGYIMTISFVHMSPGDGVAERQNRFLLDNLGFLEYFPAYQLVDDLEFIDHIHQIEYFSSRAKVAPDPGIVRSAKDSNEQKRLRIDGMGLGRKRLLLANYHEFEQLPIGEQQRLLKLHHDILSADAADIFSKTLITYAQWYQQLDPLEQVELALRSKNTKVVYVQQLVKTRSPSTKYFTVDDFFVVKKWLEEAAVRNENKLLRNVKKVQRDTISNLPKQKKSRALMALLLKNANRNKVLLWGPVERKQYDSMKGKLSPSFQQSLADQGSLDGEIRLLIEVVRRTQRNQWPRSMRQGQ